MEEEATAKPRRRQPKRGEGLPSRSDYAKPRHPAQASPHGETQAGAEPRRPFRETQAIASTPASWRTDRREVRLAGR
jgi:hypothetical protein